MIALLGFSDAWQPTNSADPTLSKFQIYLHFSGMGVLFFTRFRFPVRHLDFRQNGASDKVGTNTVEIFDPENIGVDTEIMFVSRRVPKLEGGCNFAYRPRRRCKKIGPPSEG